MSIGAAAALVTCLLTSCGSAQENYAPAGAPALADVPAGQPAHRWPMVIDAPDGQITIYQPQLTNFDGNKISDRAAVSVLKPGQQDPVFGAMWMESRVATDKVARTVQVLDVTVTRVRFPDPNVATEQSLTDALRQMMPQQPMTLSLDQLLAMLEVVQKEKETASELSDAPPKIIFRDHPAVLIQYDGSPRLMQDSSGLMRVVNTPFFVALDPGSRTYFLKGGGRWYAASDPLGPFAPAAQVPQAVAALADSSGYKDPQQPLTDTQAAAAEIVTATDPTELVWTDGPEEMGTIPNTDLLYVTNTPSDLFLQIDTQQLFVLLSGRWYTAPNSNGPWTNVAPDKLPPDFKLIPPDSEKGNVLADVDGTQAASDAVADTFVPQTAEINRQDFQQPTVQYDGDPNFQPIENTQMQYAVNTPSSIVLVGGRYYCCSNAVWYVGPAANGPWALCTEVPAEIYTIPPSCPVYPVRYVYVYQVTPTVIYTGYLPGYVGCYRHRHVVVYGTGYRYQPWVGRVYYPRPHTYGFAAQYDAYNGYWGFSVGARVGNGAAWIPARTGPVVVRGGNWFGHGGYRPIDQDWNGGRRAQVDVRRPDIQRQDLDIYSRRRDVRPIVAPARPAPVAPREQPGSARQGPRPAAPSADRRNNVYADPNGQVYRKTIDGWEQRDNGTWAPAENPPKQAPKENSGNKPPTPKEKPGSAAPPPPRETPVKEPPAKETPAKQPPVKEAPANDNRGKTGGTEPPPKANTPAPKAPAAPAEPTKPAEKPGNAKPAPRNDNPGGLNRDYHARVAGQQRAKVYQPSQSGGSQSAPRAGGGQQGSGGQQRGGGQASGGGQSGGGNQHAGGGQQSSGGGQRGGSAPAPAHNAPSQGAAKH